MTSDTTEVTFCVRGVSNRGGHLLARQRSQNVPDVTSTISPAKPIAPSTSSDAVRTSKRIVHVMSRAPTPTAYRG